MESQDSFKSTVSDLIKYEFLDPPSWRNQDQNIPSVEGMINEMIDFQESWDSLKIKIEAQNLENIKERLREKYCDFNTDPLKDESGLQKKQRESRNLLRLLEFFDKRRDENQQNCGLIDESMVQEAHEVAVDGMHGVRPGKFSKDHRGTTYKGEKYWYQKPEDMECGVNLVLDRFNSLLISSTCKTGKKVKLESIFKSLAWFLFEILDLHPFGNGNGKLFRSFCFYVLSSLGHTFFPCPIYHTCDERENHDHSACHKPCKDNYQQALVDTRKSATRHPQELATMLIESCWRTWGEFMDEVQKCMNS